MWFKCTFAKPSGVSEITATIIKQSITYEVLNAEKILRRFWIWLWFSDLVRIFWMSTWTNQHYDHKYVQGADNMTRMLIHILYFNIYDKTQNILLLKQNASFKFVDYFNIVASSGRLYDVILCSITYSLKLYSIEWSSNWVIISFYCKDSMDHSIFFIVTEPSIF